MYSEGQPKLHLKVQDLTRLDASIMYNPNRDIMEERKLTSDYSVK